MTSRLLCFSTVSALLVIGCAGPIADDPADTDDPAADEDVATAAEPLAVADEVVWYWGSATGGSALCDTSYPMVVAHPTGNGKYPVLVITPGTGQYYAADGLRSLAWAMAGRGFVAATVAYANGANDAFGCGGAYEAKARCIFSPDLSTRAIRKLCAHANADCNKGIVTTGVSQGGVLAILAANFDGRVRATVARSVGTKVFEADGACLASWNTAISKDRLRVINGEMDVLFADTWMQAPANPAVMNAVTGRSCPLGAYSCLGNPGGSGWRRVGTWEVQDGYPGHCYFLNTPSTGMGECLTEAQDPTYLTGNADWSRDPSLVWLDSFTD